MKTFLYTISITFLIATPFCVKAQENDFTKEYLERMANSKKYLLLVAETMPEDKYDYKATPNQ